MDKQSLQKATHTLEYCITSRRKGLDSAQIEKHLDEKSLPPHELAFFLKESDKIYLAELRDYRAVKTNRKGYAKRIIILTISLVVLIAVFLGYARVGIITLLILWSYLGSQKLVRSKESPGGFFKRIW